jgi:Asp-tRNA(Asn)/Glu-tRNA(Gln) amidotransferase A subunit family amidase
MTQEQFSELLTERDRVRNVYATLKGQVDVCVTLSAPSAAPKGLDWTGDPLFTVPTSLVGMPTVTLPVLQDESFPLGLQVIGHPNADADLFSHAGGILKLF